MQENISVTDSYSTGNAAQAMLEQLLQIYDVKTLVAHLNGVGENHWSAAILKRALANDSAWHRLSEKEFAHLQTLLPIPPAHHPHYAFRFIDLFAGIGGIRRGFESIGGQCVFTSEWNKHAVRTYKANYYCDPAVHHFNEDIRDITLSHKEGIGDDVAAEHIRQHIPEHDVLLAGFPCQPFSLAGVSKKNSLGRAHGFACDTQGTLFFDVVRIIDARRPAIFVVGLVAITPGAGFVPIWSSFIIGALVSPICYFGVGFIKERVKIDDALDAFGCHGIGGIWGGLATGIFAKSSINSVAKWDGLAFGDFRLFRAQIIGILITIVIAVLGTLICTAIVKIFTPLRVSEKEEKVGLDISQHGENAYPSFNGLD